MKVEQPRQPELRFSARTSFIVACCVALLVFAVYIPSLGYQFILDDHRFTSDPRIRESGHIWDYFANYVWAQFTGGPPSFYRPVFVLWVRLNFLFSEMSPWGWHLLSVAKHMFVAGLLGTFGWKLLRSPAAGVVASMLFALHPAQTESVSWVTVPDPLMAAGLLVALLCYLEYVKESRETQVLPSSVRKKAERSSQNSFGWLVGSATAYFGALLAKETAIVFPVVVVALDFCRTGADISRNRAKNVKSGDDATLRALRHVAPFAVVTAVYLLMRLTALGNLSATTQHLPWTTVALSAPATLWFYAKVLFWPVQSYSFADPTLVETFSVRSVLLPLAGVLCAAAVLSGATIWAWRTAQRRVGDQGAARVKATLVVGVLLLVLPLLLTLNLNALNPGDFLHGRYTYLPLAGLMLVVATLWRLTGKFQLLTLFVIGALAIAYAALTFAQEKQWKDDVTVFTVAHQIAPRNLPVARNLANTRVQGALALDEEGRCNEAMPVFDEVARDFPDAWYAWAGLGDCYVQLNNFVKAEEMLHRAADLSHDSHVIQQWQELRAHMGLPNSIGVN